MRELLSIAACAMGKLLGAAAALCILAALVLAVISGSAEDFAAICGTLRYSAAALLLGLGLGGCGLVVHLIGGVGNE